jgi:hypothetical protein
MEGIDTALAGDVSVDRVSYRFPDADGRLSQRAAVVCRRGRQRSGAPPTLVRTAPSVAEELRPVP